MATAICDNCAKGIYFVHGGPRLSEIRCQCGSRISVAQKVGESWVPRSPDAARRIKQHWERHNLEWDGFAKRESFGSLNY